MSGAAFLFESLSEAVRLIFSGDRLVFQAAFTSVWVAAVSTALASAVGLPAGVLLSMKSFPGRRVVVALLEASLALPTVVVGLFVYAFIRRDSLLGPLDLLFSPPAMILGQVLLALPILSVLSCTAVSSLDPAVQETAATLGASPRRARFTTAWEARRLLVAAVAAAGGRLLGEVGVSMILGGNIVGYTRTLPTAIALEASKGEFAFAVALGLVLVTLALGVAFLLRFLRRRGESV